MSLKELRQFKLPLWCGKVVFTPDSWPKISLFSAQIEKYNNLVGKWHAGRAAAASGSSASTLSAFCIHFKDHAKCKSVESQPIYAFVSQSESAAGPFCHETFDSCKSLAKQVNAIAQAALSTQSAGGAQVDT